MLPSLGPTFGDLLREHRRAAGLTQQELAERAGLSVHGVQKLECGATHPYRDTAQRLIAALHLTAADETRLRETVGRLRHQTTARPQEAHGTVRHNLPLGLSSFIGREQALIAVTSRLGGARLVTLTGVGGCGKTRLALEVAGGVTSIYPDGVWLVELAPLLDPDLVPHRVGALLGAHQTADQSISSALASAVSSRRVLVILDNCEHLLPACAVLVDALLRACPELHVLATSREPLRSEGELIWRVPSLPVPEIQPEPSIPALEQNAAVKLFLERATATQPRFALTGRNAAAVARICRRLDGLPLALELAAALVEALPADQLAARLDQRFRLLTGGSPAALPRQQTLGAT
ncbi:MAG: helix-turn-helix domain-containing protein, partial [Chloroflexota bacterium]|nr:helix-turn-helix domain-containing protein [Chloroflexota bacterium]